MLQWHSFLFHTYHFLSFKKANSHHGRPCKARPATKTQQYLSILLIPTERRAYNTSSFLYPNTVLTAFGNSRQYTGSSESKDGTHTDAAAVLTVPVTAHATIGLHVPVPCEEFRVLRRRPKPPTASKIILAVCGNFLHPCV